MSEPLHNSSAAKLLDILILFGEHTSYLSIEEIRDRLALPQSTTYRYVRLLCDKGFLYRAQEGQYELGQTLFELRQRAFGANRDLRLIARPAMKRIAEELHESVFLMRLYENVVVCIEGIEGRHALRVTIEPGRLRKLHAGAPSKAILAHLPEKEWGKRLDFPLEAYTHATLTEQDTLFAELREIRESGYASSEGEVNPGVKAIAVPVVNTHGNVFAALTIEGPASRMTDNLLARSADLLHDEAAFIHENLL